MKFIIRDRATGTDIDEFATLEEAKNALREYEEEDERDGCYTDNFYEIFDTDVTLFRVWKRTVRINKNDKDAAYDELVAWEAETEEDFFETEEKARAAYDAIELAQARRLDYFEYEFDGKFLDRVENCEMSLEFDDFADAYRKSHECAIFPLDYEVSDEFKTGEDCAEEISGLILEAEGYARYYNNVEEQIIDLMLDCIIGEIAEDDSRRSSYGVVLEVCNRIKGRYDEARKIAEMLVEVPEHGDSLWMEQFCAEFNGDFCMDDEGALDWNKVTAVCREYFARIISRTEKAVTYEDYKAIAANA